MKIREIENSNIVQKPAFSSVYTNKGLQKTFNFAQENSALFVATATLGLSGVVRPMVVLATPDTDKENKKYAAAKSIASSLTGFVIMLALSRPLVKAIKKIDEQPFKYLKKETVKNLKDAKNDLKNSKGYIMATQLLKLGLSMAVAVPKSMLTVALIPPICGYFFSRSENDPNHTHQVAFKGQNRGNLLPSILGKIIDSKSVQKIVKKFKNSNYEMTIISATDVLSTAGFIYQNKKTENIDAERKKALNYNVIFSTAMSIIGACTLDKALEGRTNKFISKFKQENPKLKNLEKYAEGIKITKKVFLLGGLYYGVIPLLATFFADKAQKNNQK